MNTKELLCELVSKEVLTRKGGLEATFNKRDLVDGFKLSCFGFLMVKAALMPEVAAPSIQRDLTELLERDPENAVWMSSLRDQSTPMSVGLNWLAELCDQPAPEWLDTLSREVGNFSVAATTIQKQLLDRRGLVEVSAEQARTWPVQHNDF